MLHRDAIHTPPEHVSAVHRPVDATRGAERSIAGSLASLTRRIDAEYRDMPGLTLTAAQAARLFGLERETCLEVLQALVSGGRLRRTTDQRYCGAGALQRVMRTL